MAEKSRYVIGRHLLLCLTVISGSVLAQNCDPLLTLGSITDPGQYSVATLTEADGIRNGPDYSGATIYYPTNATPPFPSIAIVPGYVSPQSSIQEWGPFLASHGIVVMTIGTNSLFDDPYARRDALLDAIVTIAGENTRTASPIIGDLDLDRISVGGWSMGGGGAQLAAAADPTLKAVVALCPWLDGQTTAADLIHPVPVLIFSAQLDAIAPPAAHATLHYGYTPQTTNKLLFEIAGAGHSVANSPTGGQDQVGQIALSWLKHYLIGDDCYCPLVLDAPSTASSYMTNVTCPELSTAIDESGLDGKTAYRVYPSPCSESINVDVAQMNDGTTYEIRSITGATVSSGRVHGRTTTIDVQDLSTGMYMMNVITHHTSEQIRFIVR